MLNKLFQNPLETLKNKDLEMIQQMQLQQQSTLPEPLIMKEEIKQNEFVIKVKDNKRQISLKLDNEILIATDKICNETGLSRNEYIEECLKYCNQNIKIVKAN